MQIWVDADACPGAIKEILFRAAERERVQINLVAKHDRDVQSHEIARRLRPAIQEIARQYGANVKIVEVPPGQRTRVRDRGHPPAL